VVINMPKPALWKQFPSSNNLITNNAGVKRKADQGGSTARAAATVFCPFQKHSRETRRTVEFLLSSGTKGTVKNV
jgi:hypothetical protein